MSMAIVRWFQDTRFMYNQLSVRERSTFTQIAIYCNDDGYPFYSMNKIAAQIGQTSGHFSRDAKKLFELGLLVKDGRSFRVSDMCIGKVRHRISAKMLNGRYTVVDEVSHEYSDTLPQMEETATKVVAPSEGGCYQGGSSAATKVVAPSEGGCYQGGSSAATKVVAPVSYNRKEENNKKENTTPTPSNGQKAYAGYASSARPYRNPTGRPDFVTQGISQRPSLMSHIRNARTAYSKAQLDFVKAYPKAESDPAAFLEAWSVVIGEGIKEDDLVRAAGDYAAKMTYDKDDGAYIQTPENWLTRKGYAIYVRRYEEERSQQQSKQRQDMTSGSDIADFDPFDTAGFDIKE